MKVTIPAREQHQGLFIATLEIGDKCPTCGGPRGETHKGFSFDGSRRLTVDVWQNPCGHVDYYWAVREEARALLVAASNASPEAKDFLRRAFANRGFTEFIERLSDK